MTSAGSGKKARPGSTWRSPAGSGSARTAPTCGPSCTARNLTVQARCLATGLHVRHGRCTGVSYLRDGVPAQAHTGGEVIVCAGAVGSPQLLLLSGIGPAGQLRALGISPVADLPGVGENLQDHPVVMACYAAPGPLPRSRYNHGEIYAALRSGLAGACPDLHLFPILLPVAPAGYPAPPAGFALVAAVVAPDSRGTLRLASADPRAAPLIDPGFLREQTDVDRLEAGLGLIRTAAATAAFSRVHAAGAHLGAGAATRAGVRDFIRRTVGSYYHPAGTCRMGPGPDAGAVVDLQLRVRGITGLRVADASVMPVDPQRPPERHRAGHRRESRRADQRPVNPDPPPAPPASPSATRFLPGRINKDGCIRGAERATAPVRRKPPYRPHPGRGAAREAMAAVLLLVRRRTSTCSTSSWAAWPSRSG